MKHVLAQVTVRLRKIAEERGNLGIMAVKGLVRRMVAYLNEVAEKAGDAVRAVMDTEVKKGIDKVRGGSAARGLPSSRNPPHSGRVRGIANFKAVYSVLGNTFGRIAERSVTPSQQSRGVDMV